MLKILGENDPKWSYMLTDGQSWFLYFVWFYESHCYAYVTMLFSVSDVASIQSINSLPHVADIPYQLLW